MGSKDADLHILFFPFMADGHMLPLVDMAKIFAAHGARATILTTPVNADIIRPTIDTSAVHLHIIPFPSAEFGLPEGCENRRSIPSNDLRFNFFKAVMSLRHPFDAVLGDLHPDCVISDVFLPWTYCVAAARGIPRLFFHGFGNFACCVIGAYKHHRSLVDEAESFVLPHLPCQFEMLKAQFFDINKFDGTPMQYMLEAFKEIEEVGSKSYGVVMNSFYELEPEYVDYNREVMKRKLWNIGPLSLCNHDVTSMLARGGEMASPNEYLKWLDSKPRGTVVYMCFGSGSLFLNAQLRQMALGLEASMHPFIWVMRNISDEWMPEGYDERIRGRGVVIRGWAPQLMILNHDAVGGFVTHCGWNSSLEGIIAGLPMVTWPLYAEQFYNEKLLVNVLKIGVAVGSNVCSFNADERTFIEASAVEVAIRKIMGGGEEDVERRMKAKELGKMARKAMEKGGSSYEDVDKLIEELKGRRKHV